MPCFRNQWIDSAGLALAWAVMLLLAVTISGHTGVQPLLWVRGGYALGWVSTTMARYAYRLPRRWGVTRP